MIDGEWFGRPWAHERCGKYAAQLQANVSGATGFIGSPAAGGSCEQDGAFACCSLTKDAKDKKRQQPHSASRKLSELAWQSVSGVAASAAGSDLETSHVVKKLRAMQKQGQDFAGISFGF